MNRAPLPGARHAQEILDALAAKGARGAHRGPAVLQGPAERDRPMLEARSPEPTPLAHAPALAPPIGTRVARELGELRDELARVLHVTADALGRDDVGALLEAADALEALRAREVRLVTVTIGDAWREHRDALAVAQEIGSAAGMLRRAVDRVRRVPL